MSCSTGRPVHESAARLLVRWTWNVMNKEKRAFYTAFTLDDIQFF